MHHAVDRYNTVVPNKFTR